MKIYSIYTKNIFNKLGFGNVDINIFPPNSYIKYNNKYLIFLTDRYMISCNKKEFNIIKKEKQLKKLNKNYYQYHSFLEKLFLIQKIIYNQFSINLFDYNIKQSSYNPKQINYNTDIRIFLSNLYKINQFDCKNISKLLNKIDIDKTEKSIIKSNIL